MFVRTLFVDKALARLLLDGATFPMPLDKEKLARYAHEMRNRRWSKLIADGSTIVRSGNVLKNGRHRLLAVIESDTHQVFRVAVLLPGWDCTSDGQIFEAEGTKESEAA